jgi:transposase
MASPNPRQNRYPEELRHRAVQLVLEWRDHNRRRDGGITEIARQLGVHPESVRGWLRLYEARQGKGSYTTTDDKARIAELERENSELRRANEILKSAAVFFGAELDRRPKK